MAEEPHDSDVVLVLVQALFLVEAQVTEASLPRFASVFEACTALASAAFLAFSSAFFFLSSDLLLASSSCSFFYLSLSFFHSLSSTSSFFFSSFTLAVKEFLH